LPCLNVGWFSYRWFPCILTQVRITNNNERTNTYTHTQVHCLSVLLYAKDVHKETK
jgi:hypothetical protein